MCTFYNLLPDWKKNIYYLMDSLIVIKGIPGHNVLMVFGCYKQFYIAKTRADVEFIRIFFSFKLFRIKGQANFFFKVLTATVS